MDTLKCLVNQKTLMEACIIGVITLIIGIICIKISEKKEDKQKNTNKSRLYISIFVTGFLLHFIIEIIGLNKWYCDKKCMAGIRNISNLNNIINL
jgi:uncharacterized membrane protein